MAFARRLKKEYEELKKNPPPGVRLDDDVMQDNVNEWDHRYCVYRLKGERARTRIYNDCYSVFLIPLVGLCILMGLRILYTPERSLFWGLNLARGIHLILHRWEIPQCSWSVMTPSLSPSLQHPSPPPSSCAPHFLFLSLTAHTNHVNSKITYLDLIVYDVCVLAVVYNSSSVCMLLCTLHWKIVYMEATHHNPIFETCSPCPVNRCYRIALHEWIARCIKLFFFKLKYKQSQKNCSKQSHNSNIIIVTHVQYV